MVRANTPKSVRAVTVIEVKANRGLGIEGDPVRVVTQYWDMKGNFLAEMDADTQLVCDQARWESERLTKLIEDYKKGEKK